MSRETAKTRWGSHPNHERGRKPSASERAYIQLVADAHEAGAIAARRPRCGEHSIPDNYTAEERSYWLTAFRAERRRMARPT
jgi:hypothetical protein